MRLNIYHHGGDAMTIRWVRRDEFEELRLRDVINMPFGRDFCCVCLCSFFALVFSMFLRVIDLFHVFMFYTSELRMNQTHIELN